MSDLADQYLGQYQILTRISKGATSTIYKAYQPKLERFVAIKVLSPHVVDEEGFLERFAQEACAVAQLDHPNIVPVYDFDREGDMAYIVMKYVESGTLFSMMKGSPMDLGLAVDILTQIGLALGYAHRRGVIHRDVKPSNILIGERHWAMLTDFGLAKILGGERHITRSGVGMGTPDYMSPEQAQGTPGDGRSDLYSLGATLYEMVTGRPPFQADSLMGVVVKHITEPPVPPRQLNPGLPEALESAILTALAKDPADRFQTAEAMVAAVVRGAGPVLGREAMSRVDPAAISVTRPIEPVSPLPIRERKLSKLAWLVRVMVGVMTLALVGLATVVIRLTLESPMGQVAVSPLATPTLSLPTTTALPVTPAPASSPAQTTQILPSATPLPALPKATRSPVPPKMSPSPTPEWTYLPSSTPIRSGIYVKVVRPGGLDVLVEPGFDNAFITTLPADEIIYVLDEPKIIKSLWWIKVTDGTTTGWGVQDYVVAFGIRER
jgi:serine/threonine protein kinase